MSKPTKDEYFQLRKSSGGPSHKIDRVNNIIAGAKIVQLGEVSDDRPWSADNVTLSQTIDIGNSFNKGLKARFSHPTAENPGLGRFLGRWKNFRQNGDAVYADLHLSDAAFDAPGLGDVGSYLMAMATDDPESFGVSLHALINHDETFEADGALRFSNIKAADLVDEPALTRGGLFNKADASNKQERAVDMTAEKTPEVTPEVTPEASPKVEPAVFDLEQASENAKPFIEAFGDAGALAFLEGKSLLDCFKEDRTRQAEALKASQDRLAEVSKELADLKAFAEDAGEPEPVSSDPVPEVSQAQKFSAEAQAKGVAPSTAKIMGGLYSEK